MDSTSDCARAVATHRCVAISEPPDFATTFVGPFDEALKFGTFLDVRRHATVYSSGSNDRMIYVIRRGAIKLVWTNPAGKACLFAIRRTGDLFGEQAFAGIAARDETAAAISDTQLVRFRPQTFLSRIAEQSLIGNFVAWLAEQVADHQKTICWMATAEAEQRLAWSLLSIARKLGERENGQVRVRHRISHQELSEIVGTTRPRVSAFMERFRRQGLVTVNHGNVLTIHEARLAAFLQDVL